MDNPKYTGVRPETGPAGSYDEAAGADRMAAIDLAMRHYFQADNWIAERNRRSPGLRPRDG
ncbi:MAG: hypothetical protein HY673_00440 [Chloroflexi bacterium]|nr:hypothetical protein [Chloroflexota bacterium]